MPSADPHPADADPTVRHLYVHVPFCPTICPFCDFHVLERRGPAVEEYLGRLDRELAEAAELRPFDLSTVYVGGGTPSHLRTSELEQLREIVGRRVGWASDEATLEVHPSTASERRSVRWAELGFDRLSVGVQSFDDDVLARLGRPHDAGVARRAVEWCRATGATTSVDVIVAVEGQDVAADLAEAAASGVDHVSAYTLTIEPGTPFDRDGVVVPDERAADALSVAATVLGDAGFERYEVSNHARPGARCRHNQAYWRGAWFLGVGPSASSFLPADGRPTRSRNAEWVDWLDGVEPDLDPVGPDELLGDLVLCGLRLRDGIDLDELQARCGADLRVSRAAELETLVADRLVEVVGSVLRATDRGVLVLDRVVAELT